MTCYLPRPFESDDPLHQNSPRAVLVERVAVDDKGDLALQGRALLADGTKGAVRSWPLRAADLASVLHAHVTGRRCMIETSDPGNPWAELKEKLDMARNTIKRKNDSFWVTYGSPFGGPTAHKSGCKHAGDEVGHGRWLTPAEMPHIVARDCTDCGGQG